MNHCSKNGKGEISWNSTKQKWPETGYDFQPSIITLLGVFKRQRFKYEGQINLMHKSTDTSAPRL